jgi:hypothetical protein
MKVVSPVWILKRCDRQDDIRNAFPHTSPMLRIPSECVLFWRADIGGGLIWVRYKNIHIITYSSYTYFSKLKLTTIHDGNQYTSSLIYRQLRIH